MNLSNPKGRLVMSEQKKKMILAIVLASVLVILLGEVSVTFFPAQQKSSVSTPNAAPFSAPASSPVGGSAGAPAIIETPLVSAVELNSSEGFNSSIIASGSASSSLLVLSPGGTGSVPFLVYSNGIVNGTVNVSLNVDLWSPPDASDSVQFNVSPSNLAISPGAQVKAVLTITADTNAPTAYYMPYIDIQENFIDNVEIQSPGILETQLNMTDLLVANSTPSCLFLVNENELTTTVTVAPAPSSPLTGNASAGIIPPVAPPPTSTFTPTPTLFVVPTINMTPGEITTVTYSCLTQDNLSLNITAPTGLSTQFSPSPLDIIIGSTTGKMYALTVTADKNLSSGTYQVNTTGSLGSYQFDASFNVVIK